MILSRQIKSTKTFVKSNYAIKRMILSKTNLFAIKKGYERAKEIGFKEWKNNTNAGLNNLKIVKELINKSKHHERTKI